MKTIEKRAFQITFTRILLKWDRDKNTRQMPWKGESDPYKIWLSEIILQQTRVEQGMSYYRNFIKSFPTVHHLAKAPDNKIFKLWEGLGYYNRCSNLIYTGRYISKEKNGIFPDSFSDLKTLKGIGPYTAAAIASFAFHLPHAVVDGNVFRVLSRIFGIDKPIDSGPGKKYITELADQLLDKKKPGLYNQAIMDFGAVVCKPKAPICISCPFTKICIAYKTGRVNNLPVKEKKTRIKKRWFYFLVLEYKNKVLIRQRTDNDIWQKLYEYPMIEAKDDQTQRAILQKAEKKGWLKKNKYNSYEVSKIYKQQLSHQLILARFIKIRLDQAPLKTANGLWENKSRLIHYAFPKIINNYLDINVIG